MERMLTALEHAPATMDVTRLAAHDGISERPDDDVGYAATRATDRRICQGVPNDIAAQLASELLASRREVASETWTASWKPLRRHQ